MDDHKQGLTNFIRFQIGSYDVFVSKLAARFAIHYDYPDGTTGYKSFKMVGTHDGYQMQSLDNYSHAEFMYHIPSDKLKMIKLKVIDVLDNLDSYALQQRKKELGMEESVAGRLLRRLK